MPIIQSRTRKEIRQSIGDHLGAVTISTTTSAGNGGGTTLVDTTLIGSDDEHIGKHVVTSAGSIVRVSDFTSSSGTLTFASAASAQIADDTEYELWDERYPPDRINRVMNDAISEVSSEALIPDNDSSIRTHGEQEQYDIPTNLVMIRRVAYLDSIKEKTVLDSSTAWDELVDTDVTAAKDSEVHREGGASARFISTASIGNGDRIATDSITSLDLSSYDKVQFWIRVKTAVAAADLTLLLDDTASCGSPIETSPAMNLPAISARTWTWVSLSLATPELDTAIISVGLEYNANAGANTIWISRIRAIRSETAEYTTLDPWNYKVDRESRKLILSQQGRQIVKNTDLRLYGFDKPALFSSDSDTCEIDPEIVTYLSLYRITTAIGAGRATDPDDMRPQAIQYRSLAAARIAALPTPQGVPTY